MVVAGLLIAALAVSTDSGTTGLVTPRTLVIEHGGIHKFAQDGDFITWIGDATTSSTCARVGRSSWVSATQASEGGRR